MGKLPLSARKFRKKKGALKSTIKHQRFLREKRQKEKLKQQRLLNEEPEIEEEVEQQDYLNQTKEVQKQLKKDEKSKKPLTSEEVKEFLANLGESDIEQDEDIDELIADVKDIDDEVYEEVGDDSKEEKQTKEEDKDEEDEEGDEEEGEEEEEEGDEEENEEDTSVNEEKTKDILNDEMDLDIPEIGYGDEEDEEDTDKTLVTKDLLKKWIYRIKKNHCTESMKKLLLAFYAAVHKDDEDAQEILDTIPFAVKKQSIYLRVLFAGLKYIVLYLNKAFKRDLNTTYLPGNRGSAWKKHSNSIRTFARAIYHLLDKLKDEKILPFVLMYVYDALPYCGHMHTRISRKILKILLNHLGNEKEMIRFRAFLCIHRMAMMYPFPFLNLCLKGVYFTLLQNCNQFTVETFPVIEFLINATVELFGIDFNTSYEFAFHYIKELANSLRNALPQQHQKQTWALCYNQRFMTCLKVFTDTLCAYPKELHDLIYPLVQIIIGVTTLNKNVKFLPLKYRCAAMLNKLTKHTGVYIPVSPIILEALEAPGVAKTSKKTTPFGVDFEFALKVRKAQVETIDFQQRAIEEGIYLLSEYLNNHARSIAFPEIAYSIEVYLKKYKKDRRMKPGTAKKLTNLLKIVKQNIDFILEKRSNVKFTPCDIEKANSFLPMDVKTPFETYFEKEKEQHDKMIALLIQAKRGEQPVVEDLDESEPKAKKKTKKESSEEKPKEETKKKSKKRKSESGEGKKKKKPKIDTEQEDIVEELKLEDI